MAFPVDATPMAWFWLVLSGLVGFVFGDYFLFKSYTIVSSRIAMLIMTLVPPITALIGWIILGEVLSLMNALGMLLTIGGIFLAIFTRNSENGKIGMNYPWKGILFAFGGAIGQAVGLVLSKKGMGSYDAFAATQIRIIAGLVGFAAIIFLLKKHQLIGIAVKNRKGMLGITIGSFFGPFLGVSFSLLAIQYTTAGVASTIMSIVPVLIILPAILLFKQKVSLIEVVGAIVSVIGVSLFFV